MATFRRISNLFSRSKLEREIQDELRSHLDMRTAENIAAGMTPERAHRDALLRFGNLALMKERMVAEDAPHGCSDFGGFQDEVTPAAIGLS